MAPLFPSTSRRESLEWHPSTVSSKHCLYRAMAHTKLMNPCSKLPPMKDVQAEREEEGDSIHTQCLAQTRVKLIKHTNVMELKHIRLPYAAHGG
nr:MAG: hypothetical protein [Marsupenaeus japonicus pemonivirus]